jgi:small-conductance mechanosensitive channel
MRVFSVVLVAIALTGCGVETTTAVATGAAIKKQEIEEGQKTQQRAQQRIDQAVQQMNQRAQQSHDTNSR